MATICFLSYAHVNDEPYLRKFVKELANEVLQRVKGFSDKEIVFFDRDSIKPGDEWKARLEAVATSCRVLVAICSPAFSDSEFCGKELAVFLRRIDEWKKQPANANAIEHPIISILWIVDNDAGAVPAPLKSYQYADSTIPVVYTQKGLRDMYRLTRYRSKQKETVTALAAAIVALLKKINLPALSAVPSIDLVQSAFTSTRKPVRYGVAMLPLLAGKMEEVPFAGGPTLRSLIDKVCGAEIPWRQLDQSGAIKADLKEADKEREVTVLVADLKTLGDPIYAPLLKTVGAELKTNTPIFVSAPQADPTALQNARITVFGAFDRNDLQPVFVDSAEALRTKMATDILRIRSALIAADPAQKVEDDALVNAARQQGVEPLSQPTLAGPSGGGS